MDPAWLSEDLLSTLTKGAAGDPSVEALRAGLGALKTIALWNARARAREQLVDALRAQGQQAGDSDALWIGWAGPLDIHARAGLLLSDLARLERLLDDPVNAVRMVIAGTPRDPLGETVHAELERLADSARFGGRLFLLGAGHPEAQRIVVQGVDLWLDASSKRELAVHAAANGALVCARVDEGETPLAGGWSLSPLAGFDDQAGQDAHDVRELFELLEREVVPLFYDWNPQAVPERWVERVRASLRAAWG